MKSFWSFIQDEILGMNWLNRLIASLLNACGLDTEGRIGGSVLFFLYDMIKIMVLLGVLILIISYIQSYFPPERKKDPRTLPRRRCERDRRVARYGNALLLLLVNPAVYRLYKRRLAARRNLFLPYLFSDGRSGLARPAYEHLRLERRVHLRA